MVFEHHAMLEEEEALSQKFQQFLSVTADKKLVDYGFVPNYRPSFPLPCPKAPAVRRHTFKEDYFNE